PRRVAPLRAPGRGAGAEPRRAAPGRAGRARHGAGRRLPRHSRERAQPRGRAGPARAPALAARPGAARARARLVLGATRRRGGARVRRPARGLRREPTVRPPAARAPRLRAAVASVAGGVPERRLRGRAAGCGAGGGRTRVAGATMSPRARSPWLAAPLVLYLALFLLFPSLHALVLAFRDPASGALPSVASFRTVARDALFWRALAGNVLVPAVTVAIEIASGLALALLLAERLPARRLL